MGENIYTVEYIVESNLDKKEFGFIYITKYKIEGNKYIGKRKFSNGWKSYLSSGLHIKRAINLYGKENFERSIIDIAYSEKELNNKERYWIKYFNAVTDPNYYNIQHGGEGAASGKYNHMFGRHFKHSEKTKKKISIANKGHSFSDKAKRNISLHHKNVSGENNPMYGKHRSEELKKKLSDSMKRYSGKNSYWYGKNISDEAKEKSRNTWKEKGKTKSVVQLNKSNNKIINIFDSLADAHRNTNVDVSSIIRVCKGKTKSAGGFKWMYYDEYIKQQNN